MLRANVVLGVTGLFLFGFNVARAQATPKLDFEVVSIRPSGPKPALTREQLAALPPELNGPEYFYSRRQSIPGLVIRAYELDPEQVIYPKELLERVWDISAKAPASATREQAAVMWQNLLRDRFHLVYHTESRIMPVWELTIAKGGLIMVDSNSGKPEGSRSAPLLEEQKPGGPLWISPDGTQKFKLYSRSDGVTLMAGREASVSALRFYLQRGLRVPGDSRYVIDNTGLTGAYNFGIKFVGQNIDDKRAVQADAPDIFTAVQRYLGLQLRAAKLPVEVLVVDSADTSPTEN